MSRDEIFSVQYSVIDLEEGRQEDKNSKCQSCEAILKIASVTQTDGDFEAGEYCLSCGFKEMDSYQDELEEAVVHSKSYIQEMREKYKHYLALERI